MSRISAAAFSDTKPHYDLLDGLRGVAALTVVCFHLFEAYATSHLDQRINHGYLAVDFFFILFFDDFFLRFFRHRLFLVLSLVILFLSNLIMTCHISDCIFLIINCRKFFSSCRLFIVQL